MLATTLFRTWLRSRVVVIEALVCLLITLGLVVVRSPVAALVVVVVLVVLTPATLWLRCWRAAKAMAPAGFTLGLGLGPGHLAVRHAVATTVSPYSSWLSASRSGDVVVLSTRRGGVVPLPLELFGSDLSRLQALVSGPEEAPDAPATPEAMGDLPLQTVCTSRTRGELTWALLLRPVMVTLIAVDLLVLLAPLLVRGYSWGWALVPVATTVLLLGAQSWSTFRRLAGSSRAGLVFRAGLRDDTLVVQDATGRITIPFRGVGTITVSRGAVLIRSQLGAILAIPRALLPEAELNRVLGAVEWYRSRR